MQSIAPLNVHGSAKCGHPRCCPTQWNRAHGEESIINLIRWLLAREKEREPCNDLLRRSGSRASDSLKQLLFSKVLFFAKERGPALERREEFSEFRQRSCLKSRSWTSECSSGGVGQAGTIWRTGPSQLSRLARRWQKGTTSRDWIYLNSLSPRERERERTKPELTAMNLATRCETSTGPVEADVSAYWILLGWVYKVY